MLLISRGVTGRFAGLRMTPGTGTRRSRELPDRNATSAPQLDMPNNPRVLPGLHSQQFYPSVAPPHEGAVPSEDGKQTGISVGCAATAMKPKSSEGRYLVGLMIGALGVVY